MFDKIKVLVVDDSFIARKYLSKMLSESEYIEVIGKAKNGLEGFEQTKLLKPDVVTLDIEMPKMNGLEALEKIMSECPTPVIMISTLTKDGAKETLKALHLGAIDYIPKNDILSFKSTAAAAKKILIEKVISAKSSSVSLKRRLHRISSDSASVAKKSISTTSGKKLEKANIKLLTIAASTGGPIALEKLFSKLPKLNIPILIIQHMPKTFTGVFADSLNKISAIQIKEASDSDELKPNIGYLAPGDSQMTVSKGAGNRYIVKISKEPKTIYTPNADITFNSAAEHFKNNLLSVIMTGMGNDGFKGLQTAHNNGGLIIAQDKDSCVVWGMPRKPTQTGIADFVVSLNEMPAYISKIVLGE